MHTGAPHREGQLAWSLSHTRPWAGSVGWKIRQCGGASCCTHRAVGPRTAQPCLAAMYFHLHTEICHLPPCRPPHPAQQSHWGPPLTLSQATQTPVGQAIPSPPGSPHHTVSWKSRNCREGVKPQGRQRCSDSTISYTQDIWHASTCMSPFAPTRWGAAGGSGTHARVETGVGSCGGIFAEGRKSNTVCLLGPSVARPFALKEGNPPEPHTLGLEKEAKQAQ